MQLERMDFKLTTQKDRPAFRHFGARQIINKFGKPLKMRVGRSTITRYGLDSMELKDSFP